MKIHTSMTIEEDIMNDVEDTLREGLFRNKSHLFEYAVRKLIKEVRQK